ncbi:MAG TPA: SURF1 family protein, partial [Terriglobales bacterium]|nr:SURF1 family protein [Terriglobales bacterium]
RVGVSGHFLNDHETLVRAATELGNGYWVMTPFRTDQGFTILVNRGFVPPDRLHPADRQAGEIDGKTLVTGLLRMTEPKGGFLRKNHPGQDIWYSRDVAAIAAARNLTDIAPYFIDADAINRGWPRGGMTVIDFPNNHLVYAITWFAMALLLAIGVIAAFRSEQKRPR